MAESRGYDERSHLRIQSAVHKIERLTQGLPNSGKSDPRSVLRRVKLAGTLSATVPTTGTLRLQAADGATWIDSTIIIGEIYSGSESVTADAGDDVWIIPMQHRWYAISMGQSGSDGNGGGNSSYGCCAPCAERKYMLIDNMYAKKYKARGIPTALIPADDIEGIAANEVTLSYVGESSGLTGIADGSDYWESDSFEWTCSAGGTCTGNASDLCVWVWCDTGDTAPDSPPGPGFGVSCGGGAAHWALFADCSTGTCPEPNRVGAYSGETVVVECDGDGTVLFAGNYDDAWAYYQSSDAGACVCSTATTFTLDIPATVPIPAELTHDTGCVWSASGTATGGAWSASLDLETGVLSLSWDGGDCTAEYTVADVADIVIGSFSGSLTSSTGSCAQPSTINVTGTPGQTSDNYFWRLVVLDSNACRAGHTAYLYLVREGSAANCDDLTVFRCDLVSNPDIVIDYQNINDFRGRCGNKMSVQLPQLLNRELEDILACEVCVYPEGKTYIDTSPCLQQVSQANNRNERWPRILFLQITGGTMGNPFFPTFNCTYNIPVFDPVALEFVDVSFGSTTEACPPGGWFSEGNSELPGDMPFAVFNGNDTPPNPSCPGAEIKFAARLFCRMGEASNIEQNESRCAGSDATAPGGLMIQFTSDSDCAVCKLDWDGTGPFVNAVYGTNYVLTNHYDIFQPDGTIDGVFSSSIWTVSSGGSGFDTKVGEIEWRIFE